MQMSHASAEDAAHCDHQQWLRRMYAEHARLCAVGTNTSNAARGLPLAGAPMMWQHWQGFDAAMAAMSLDDTCRGPVYRGIGSFSSAHTFDAFAPGDSLEDDDVDQPVFRSLAPHPSTQPPTEPQGSQRDFETADKIWLETMPPLIRHQRAGLLR